MFAQLIQIAEANLTALNETADGLPTPQVTVLLTANGNTYLAVNDVDGMICEKLVNHQDTKVVRMLTMWKNGSVDLSSHRFRVTLIEMDRANAGTMVALPGVNGLHAKALGTTITNQQIPIRR